MVQGHASPRHALHELVDDSLQLLQLQFFVAHLQPTQLPDEHPRKQHPPGAPSRTTRECGLVRRGGLPDQFSVTSAKASRSMALLSCIGAVQCSRWAAT
jgi:hypothetical protein